MRSTTRLVLLLLCVIIGFLPAIASARDSVLTAIPDDAVAFAVIHNLADVNRSLDQVAQILKVPHQDHLNMLRQMTGIQKGLDEEGDLAFIVPSIDPSPQPIVLVPVSSFDDFFAALSVEAPDSGVVEVQLLGQPILVGRKGSHAALAQPSSRDALEKYLTTTNNMTADKSLADWVDSNKASIVVTSQGMKQLMPKLVSGIAIVQAQIRQAGGENGEVTAQALKMYVDLFQAAETEVDQFALGLRIDSAQTIDIVNRVQFTPAGNWAKAVAGINPAAEDLLSGLQNGPFVLAFGGIVPAGAMDQLMKFSTNMMQSQPLYNLTPEQAQKYADLSIEAMKGLRSMRMLMGVAEPGAGLYGNTSAVLTVDDSKSYMERYEKSLAGMRQLAEESKSIGIPTATSERITVGDTEALEVSMTMPSFKQAVPPGAPDPEAMMKLFTGPDGKLKVYVAPADQHSVLMVYTSKERFKAALDFYRSNQRGLSTDAGVAKVSVRCPLVRRSSAL